MIEDYNLLRNFHSILRKGGIVLITIMPFTSLNKQTGIRDALKYQKVHTHEPIQPYLYEKARRIAQFPLLMGKPAIKAFVKFIIGEDEISETKELAMGLCNPMTQEQLDRDALSFVNGWKKQFGISDLNAPLTNENQKGRKFRVELMRTVINFCIERSYRPIFVIPPVTKHLSKFYSQAFEETCLASRLQSMS